MSERRIVIIPCTCGEKHRIPDPGSTTYLRCIKSGAIVTYECENSASHMIRAANQEYNLSGNEIILGRKAQMTIDHPVLSRQHCRFDLDEQSKEYSLTDMGSRNGTWVNEVQITPESGAVKLCGGDLIRLVDLNFRYLSPEGSSVPPRPLLIEELADSGLEFPDLKSGDEDKMIGRLLGDYRILAIISQGGMGRVYRAERENTGQPCVVKTILPSRQGTTSANELLQRFLLEMELSLHLAHPNIINYYDIGQVGKSLYIAMEYFPGRDLKDWFEHTPATYEQVVNIGRQAAMGLGYAHRKGVVHRDIKPENILFNFNGQVKIIDFGVAKGVLERNNSGITVTGAFVGTLRYMAPEQLLREGEINHKCDIYSLGATLYYCLAGRSPFEKTSALAKLRKEMQKGAPPLSKYCRGVPRGLSQIIERAINVDPAARFESADEMAEALSQVRL